MVFGGLKGESGILCISQRRENSFKETRTLLHKVFIYNSYLPTLRAVGAPGHFRRISSERLTLVPSSPDHLSEDPHRLMGR